MLLAIACACACACGPPADAPWAPPVATPPRRTEPVAPAAAPDGPLRVLAVEPPPGSAIEPETSVSVRFDRPLDPASVPGAANFRYVDARAVFVEDPFLVTAAWLAPGGDVLHVQPADLLPGREVRFFIRDGALRGRDGSSLPRVEGAPDGLALEASYRVMELPVR